MHQFQLDQKVVYRPPHVRPDQPGEEGVVTSVGRSYIWVRYGSDVHSKATLPELLTPINNQGEET